MKQYCEIIKDIENELSIGYLPGAINYIDDKYEGAWSKAIDRFDHALSVSPETALEDGQTYRKEILRLITLFKEGKTGSKVDNFLDSLLGTSYKPPVQLNII